jgi:hypothetical protein
MSRRQPGQADGRQAVRQRDVREAVRLLDAALVNGAALDGGLGGRDQALDALDQADAADDRGPRGDAGQPESGQRAQLQEVGIRVEQKLDALARQQAAGLDVAAVVLLAAAFPALRQLGLQPLHGRAHGLGIRSVGRGGLVDLRNERPHRGFRGVFSGCVPLAPLTSVRVARKGLPGVRAGLVQDGPLAVKEPSARPAIEKRREHPARESGEAPPPSARAEKGQSPGRAGSGHLPQAEHVRSTQLPGRLS